jgi:hypothetical protein
VGIDVKAPLAFRVEGTGIKFPEGIGDVAGFIRLMQRTLNGCPGGARLLRRKYLIFAFGVEWEIEGEKVPMMIDHDGWAFIDCRDNSTTVRAVILRALLTAPEFCEARAIEAAQ